MKIKVMNVRPEEELRVCGTQHPLEHFQSDLNRVVVEPGGEFVQLEWAGGNAEVLFGRQDQAVRTLLGGRVAEDVQVDCA
jgi:hypothetical protein